MKKKKFTTILIGVISVVAVFWIITPYIPLPIVYHLNESYEYELMRVYRRLLLKNFYCYNMEMSDVSNCNTIYFNLKKWDPKKQNQYMKEIIKIRAATTDYLMSNPESEWNQKKIKFVFYTYADMAMYMYNYNFIDDLDQHFSKEFLYFDQLEINDISVLESISDAKVIAYDCYDSCDIDQFDIFSKFKNLDILICPNSYSAEYLEYIMQKCPNCTVIQQKDQ